MKQKIFFVLTIFIFSSACLLNTVDAVSQTMPLFKMLLSNKKNFNAVDLPKGKSTILIYFDPDCDHCQKLMNEFFKKINSFKKAQIILVTYKPLNELKDFEKKYNTSVYSNIKAGIEEPIFYLRTYYHLMLLPFTALYDKNGKLIYMYKNETPVDDLIRRLNNLN